MKISRLHTPNTMVQYRGSWLVDFMHEREKESEEQMEEPPEVTASGAYAAAAGEYVSTSSLSQCLENCKYRPSTLRDFCKEGCYNRFPSLGVLAAAEEYVSIGGWIPPCKCKQSCLDDYKECMKTEDKKYRMYYCEPDKSYCMDMCDEEPGPW